MSRMSPRDGKQTRPKTAIRGKRYLCARCRKRSPKPVKTPAPWYCPRCLARDAEKQPPEEGSS
jgi:late competence protein required for DNA uptake (superfamily II DNA/RNA helicase)